MVFRLVSAAVGLILSTALAHADFRDHLLRPNTIVVGTTGSAPPFSMIDNSGQLAGFDIAVMKKVAADLGVKVEFVQLDWAGLLPGLVAHRFDIVSSGVNRTAARLKSKDLIMLSPYIVNGVTVTKLADNVGIKGWSDVCGKTVGAIRGSTELASIKATLPAGCLGKVVEYPGWTELSLDLKNKRIDWIGMDYLGPTFLTQSDKSISVLPDFRAPSTQSVAVAPSEPDLAKAIDLLLVKYRQDGSLSELAKTYFGQGVDFSHLPPDPAD